MTDTGDPTPNEKQRELITNIDGTYLVDAGAGTGKTFAVTRRYANILDSTTASPEDILLLTFTNNAATEMKDRIVRHCDYGMTELADAPIQTFHSLCHDLLQEHGFDAPTRLGIDDRIPSTTRIIEDDIVEEALFGEFFEQFSDDHPEYAEFLRVVSNPAELLDLITELAAKGVFPTRDGWYRDGESHLDGDFEAFKSQFDDLNEPRNGGSKQSRLRSKLYQYGKDKCYLPDAPPKYELRGDGKQVPDAVARLVFEDDREALKAFVHDLYFEYLEFALARNYLNFSFLQLFAFVLLCEDHQLRDRLGFEYVMIDEFQDSSEIQFKLTLLLADTENLCVVGDWKQSIYSFQYAAVENILEFRERLTQFTEDLNTDHPRVQYDTTDVTTIELEQNYRSTESILRFSEEALVTPAAKYDSVDEESVREDIVELDSTADHDNTIIEAHQSDDEHDALVAKVQEIVGNSAYQVKDDDGGLRDPEYRDITVLTRTRDFGRELQTAADEHGLPMAYEGGIELFRTDQAKLLLAWLRILESDADRGWAPVLERAGYTLDEIKHILETDAYPDQMVAFRDGLAETESLGGVMRQVFDRYGFTGARADVLLQTVESIREASTLTRGDLIRFITRGIEHGSTHEVSTSTGENSVTVQTIHATKGLEHPIVVLANMNSGRFPPGGSSSPAIMFDDAVGLRQRKEFSDAHGSPYIYDSWKTDVVRRCLGRNYDEERRLLYVAITRAENHVVFTAGSDPNTFLEALPVEITPGPTAIGDIEHDRSDRQTLSVAVPGQHGPARYSPHSLMDDSVYEDADGGEGTEYGTQVHDFAEDYVDDLAVQPSNHDEEAIQSLVDGLAGELRAEEKARLPLDTDAGRVTLFGVIDLLQITPEAVTIIDYKTDRGRHAEREYRKQLSVYYHIITDLYPDRDVRATLFYTNEAETVDVEPFSKTDLREIVAEVITVDA
ncbi:ATP-dependent helicase [Halobacterium sp. KA-4]|uniref:UvrD-helicase domain-containing protein n=1 Tax=Halobacterium sp. KA-4 TaxID=2896367 RepID=UPI001E42C288|nr:ATP-dependent DNA helicase [Halobacterium sp. KA-4]MCD2201125.1 ATP-dependent helicase [Halobacterium sp. KA-4]